MSSSLPVALHDLEAAIAAESDSSLLRALRQRLVDRLTARINSLEAFEVSLLRPSGDAKTVTGCLPDDTLETLRERASREFGIPRDAILLCRGSRQFANRDLQMSLADLGVGRGAEFTCLRDALCRRYWRFRIAEEACEWEALIYNIELYDKFNNVIEFDGIEAVTSNGERNNINLARNAFDGHNETFWETLFGSEKIGTWVTCTLREPAIIRRIRVRQGNAGNAIRAFDVLSSE
ncbi:DUF1554 domain-containing protein, partial [Durusdinium trenchii]